MRAKIPSEVQALRELVLTQARQIQELRERLELLERENAELRSRLGQTSRNSHRPPSSDGYRKKTTRPALPKPKANLVADSRGTRARRSSSGCRRPRWPVYSKSSLAPPSASALLS